jgi:hypothetical protein
MSWIGLGEYSEHRLLTRSTIEPLVASKVAAITLQVRDFEQSSFTLSFLFMMQKQR